MLVWSGVVLFRLCWYYAHVRAALFGDSYSYMNFDLAAALAGQPVNGRPPLYGLYLYFLRALVGEEDDAYLYLAVAIQEVLAAAVLPLFYAVLRRVGLGARAASLGLLLYGLCPAVFAWDNCIMTESFSLSLSVAFFYCIVCYIQTDRFAYGAGTLVLTAALVFLRPQFLAYVAMLLVFFVWRVFCTKGRVRKTLLALLTLWCAVVAGMLFYCAYLDRAWEVFSISDAAPRQNLYVCVQRGYYTEFTDPAFVSAVEDAVAAHPDSSWDAMRDVLDAYGSRKVAEQVNGFIHTHFRRFFADDCALLWSDITATMSGYGDTLAEKTGALYALCLQLTSIHTAIFSFLRSITVLQVLCTSVGQGVVMCMVWIKRKSPPWLHMALFALLTCTSFLAYFITCGEYMRTMISVLPYTFISWGMAAQWLWRRRKTE